MIPNVHKKNKNLYSIINKKNGNIFLYVNVFQKL